MKAHSGGRLTGLTGVCIDCKAPTPAEALSQLASLLWE